jgi:hypothetical protein
MIIDECKHEFYIGCQSQNYICKKCGKTAEKIMIEFQQENTQLKAELQELRELLKEIEFIYHDECDEYYKYYKCEVCGGFVDNGHKEGCKLKTEIDKLEGRE